MEYKIRKKIPCCCKLSCCNLSCRTYRKAKIYCPLSKDAESSELNQTVDTTEHRAQATLLYEPVHIQRWIESLRFLSQEHRKNKFKLKVIKRKRENILEKNASGHKNMQKLKISRIRPNNISRTSIWSKIAMWIRIWSQRKRTTYLRAPKIGFLNSQMCVPRFSLKLCFSRQPRTQYKLRIEILYCAMASIR